MAVSSSYEGALYDDSPNNRRILRYRFDYGENFSISAGADTIYTANVPGIKLGDTVIANIDSPGSTKQLGVAVNSVPANDYVSVWLQDVGGSGYNDVLKLIFTVFRWNL